MHQSPVPDGLHFRSIQTGSYPNGFTEKGSKGLNLCSSEKVESLKLKQRTLQAPTEAILEPVSDWWKRRTGN
ncbi:unnamed protein product [Arctogadus glacialis]